MLVAVAGAAAGCSLILDFDPSGSPCGAAGNECLPGYVCGLGDVCIPESQGACDPACGVLEACDRGRCVKVCELNGAVKACAAGELCVEGTCETAPTDKALGARCTSDNDCTAPGVCLVPFSGASSVPSPERTGFCTKPCTDDDECSGNAPRCQTFTGEGTLNTTICTPTSFQGCESEGDCPSDLTCGVYAVRPVTWNAVVACRARLTSGTPSAIGASCTTGIPCVNGLCVVDNHTPSESRSCSTPCASTSECKELLGADAVCTSVTLPANEPGTVANPKLRPRLCVKETPRLRGDCSGVGTRCAADAPYCVLQSNGVMECVPACGQGAQSQACPQAAPTCRQGTAGTLTDNFCHL